MKRGNFIHGLGAMIVLPVKGISFLGAFCAKRTTGKFWRVRPSDPGWPSANKGEMLRSEVKGNLIKIEFPLTTCQMEPSGTVSLHFNKGLAGAPIAEIENARNTATNPAVLSAFALLIVAGGGEPSLPGVIGHEPDLSEARKDARDIDKAMEEIKRILPVPASYVSESDFFENDWQHSFLGANYPKLAN